MNSEVTKYLIGKDRFSINNYYIYKNEDALDVVVRKNMNDYPEIGTKVLFCSHVGGTELANILEYDKFKKQVVISFLGQPLRFIVPFSQVILKWNIVNNLTNDIVQYYEQKDIYLMLDAIEHIDVALNNFQKIKTKQTQLKNISQINEINKKMKDLEIKMHAILKSETFSQINEEIKLHDKKI